MKHKGKEKSKDDDSHKAEHAEHKQQEDESQKKPDTLESLRAEKDELFAKLQRVSADYVNYQKRAPKQISDSIAYEKERIIKKYTEPDKNIVVRISFPGFRFDKKHGDFLSKTRILLGFQKFLAIV